jgi:signal peptidase I
VDGATVGRGATFDQMSALPDADPLQFDPPPAAVTGFSHDGLKDLDPWARRSALPWLRMLRETLNVLILALVLFLGIRVAGHNYVVDGQSMFPTFEDGDLLVVNRFAYLDLDLTRVPGVDQAWRPFGTPQAGDVVVFHLTTERDLLKRVIAVEGQTVMVTGGVVYVDGVALDEPYIAEPPSQEAPLITVEPGQVFVMGDNRNHSDDSRRFGPVAIEQIVGRADIRYWPWGHMAFQP